MNLKEVSEGGSEDLQASTVTYGWLSLKASRQKRRVYFFRQSFVVVVYFLSLLFMEVVCNKQTKWTQLRLICKLRLTSHIFIALYLKKNENSLIAPITFKKNSKVRKTKFLSGANQLQTYVQEICTLKIQQVREGFTRVTSCFLTPLQSRWTSPGGISSWGKCLNATRLIHTANWSTAKHPMKIPSRHRL